MDLSRPYSAISPTVDGDVLAVLAQSDSPLSGRAIAKRVRRGSQPAVNAALERLVDHGLVSRDSAPPAYIYRLNREHVGAGAVDQMAGMRREFFRRVRQALEEWRIPAAHASVFGSAARADGDTRSDVDLFLVRPAKVESDDLEWEEQLGALREAVRLWTGNWLSISEVGDPRTVSWAKFSKEHVFTELRRDAITVAGASFESISGLGA